ncbi:MAG: hypothetical protein J0M10_11670 [Chitinophagales bacterium]|nr:hypothetical protein [Chitinophagales bacterium]
MKPAITFDIFFSRERDARRYRAHVAVLYRTENIIRYRVSAGTKEIEMEKYLYRKTNQWKVDQLNFVRQGHTRTYEKMISDIQAAIDIEMKNR